MGAAAELVDGAGAELGGASVDEGEELLGEPDPPPDPDELELLDGLEPELPAEGVAAWPACAVGWTPAAAAVRPRW